MIFLGWKPVLKISKIQNSVKTSKIGEEFLAWKLGFENAIAPRYNLRSIGIKIDQPNKLFIENNSVLINLTVPGSKLNKNYLSLEYYFVQEHVANRVIDIYKIGSSQNNVDPLTKELNSANFQ